VVRDASANESRRIAERARTAVAAVQLAEHAEIKLTVSVGVATMSTPESKDNWLKRADDALLEAKRSGKDCSVVARAV
jgi:diguanylate cyclase (GGDEF)-like protein